MAPPDIAALSASQQEALQTYVAVTNQDALAAIALLQRCEWNVQIAIARFFDGEPATDPLAEARAAASARQTTNLQQESLRGPSTQDRVEKIDTAASSISTHHHHTLRQQSLLFTILFTPVSVVYRVFAAVFAPLGFLVPGFLSRLFARLVATSAASASSASASAATRPTRRRRLPPADNARRFIREFGEEYGGEHSLPFTEAGFNLTLDNAKKELKFMLVVLLSPSHDDNAAWVHEVLLSSQLREWLASHRDDVLLWGGNVQDSEPYQVSASLQCTKFPFAALICHTAEPSSGSGMTVVMRAVGAAITAPELVAKLSAAMSTQEAQLQRARVQQAEQRASRNLRQEQDSAYERSLAQDRERARRRREEQEARARAEREAREAAEAAEARRRKLAQWKQWRAQSLPPEPPLSDASATATIRVSIRMPSGDRVIRRFRADAHLEEVYAFVECHDVIKEEEQQQQQEDQVPEPDNYDHVYGFRLVSPMPRVVYKLGDEGSVGERLGRAANLIVEPVDEDDDADEAA